MIEPKHPTKQRNARWELFLALGRRAAAGVLILLVLIYLSHFGLEMARGGVFAESLLRAAEKTLIYLDRLARGDLGQSAAASVTLRPIPVAEVVPEFILRSLGLLAAAMVIAIPIGILLGIWAGTRRRRGHSLPILLVSITGVSLPSFFAALLLQLAVIRLTAFYGRSVLPVGGFGWDEHLLLPALVLATRPIAQITRVTFNAVREVLEQDYIRTATSKGLWPKTVLIVHVLRNVAIPILTTLGVSLRFALSSLPVVEFFFGWPGLGFTLLKAISRQDDNLTVILVIAMGGLFILVNLLVELAYQRIDPRLREKPPHIEVVSYGNLLEWFPNALRAFWDLIFDNELSRWLTRRQPEPIGGTMSRQAFSDSEEPDELSVYTAQRRRSWLRRALGNLPLMLGTIFMTALLAVVLSGPHWAPHSPYTTQGLEIVDGEFRVPPFEPGAKHPWGTDVLGRDILSLVLAGAQQTLLLTAVVMIARMAVGFLLGASAGWFSGHWYDRLVLGLAEIFAAFPSLILAMILILALGIRRGMAPFVIALCFVGWGEIMQQVRGQVMVIRQKPFIEGAVATGLRVPRIVFKHVLPNLIPALVSLATLEMGAILMILGELGFVGIFIGGGAFAELDIQGPPYHYSDVPEWGALLSNVRAYARTYTWSAIYPAAAFFFAILGFNLFGEGLRQLVDQVGVGISRILNRYSVGLAVLAVIGLGWARANTGAIAFYRQQIGTFDGANALRHAAALTDPAMDGRALNTGGQVLAANYIAEAFELAGVQTAGEELTYFQPRKRDFETLDAVPQFRIQDSLSTPRYGVDYAEYPSRFRNMGQADGPARILLMGNLTDFGRFSQSIPALEGLDFSNEILVLLDADDVSLLTDLPHAGLLVVAEDSRAIARRATLSARELRRGFFGINREGEEAHPIFWISQAMAERLLKGSGRSLDELGRLNENLLLDEILEIPLDVSVSMEVVGTINEKKPTAHVAGHLPGLSNSLFGGINDQIVVVLAQYDTPPPRPDGPPEPGAVDNASGVAVMLEAIRTLQASGYQPYRTFVFVAYSGEGSEGGAPYVPEASNFVQRKFGISGDPNIEAVIEVRGLGSSDGEPLIISSGGNLRLANLFSKAADLLNVPLQPANDEVDISVVFEDRESNESGQEAPYLRLFGSEFDGDIEGVGLDSLEALSEEGLTRAGRVLTLALMMIGRELNY